MATGGGRVLARIEVTCGACGHAGVVERTALERFLGEAPTMCGVREALPKLRCSGCRSQRLAVTDDRAVLIYDSEQRTDCAHCRLPRLLPELALHPVEVLCPACKEDLASRPPPPYPMPPKGKDTCPRCKAATVIYERREDGHRFVGCSRFPSCRWSCDPPG